jgi:hypothetical protein
MERKGEICGKPFVRRVEEVVCTKKERLPCCAASWKTLI